MRPSFWSLSLGYHHRCVTWPATRQPGNTRLDPGCENPGVREIGQPAASGGVRIMDGVRDGRGLTFDLPDILDAIGPVVLGCTWEARYVASVWTETDPWDDSWSDVPSPLDTGALRARWMGQIINGRFTALDDGREVLMIEAVDSSFWLVWSDNTEVLAGLMRRFVDVTPAVPPTPFGMHG